MEVNEKHKKLVWLLKKADKYDFLKLVEKLSIDFPEYKFRFLSNATTNFKHQEVSALTLDKHTILIKQNIFGFSSQHAVMPDYYTDIMIKLIQKKELSLKYFLDMFIDRVVKFFIKSFLNFDLGYNFLMNLSLTQEKNDLNIINMLCAISNIKPHDSRFNLNYYFPVLVQPMRTKPGIEAILKDFFEIPIKVDLHQAQKHIISLEQRTALKNFFYNTLGELAFLGTETVICSKSLSLVFPILSYSEYLFYSCDESFANKIKNVINTYFGYKYNLIFEFSINANNVPKTKISQLLPQKFLLGKNILLYSKIPRFQKNIIRKTVKT